MSWEWLKLIPFLTGAFLGVIGTTFSINYEKDLPMLQMQCQYNKGTKSVRIDMLFYRMSCKDGAKFIIDR